MTLAQAKKLKVGDPVIWPEGANGCSYDFSFVKHDEKWDALYVEWFDGQRTYLHDEGAVKWLEKGKTA